VLYLKIAVVLLVAAFLEGFVPNYWQAFSLVDLPLLVAVYVALMRDPWLGMGVGCAAGLVGDNVPGAAPIMGVGGFTKTAIGFFVAFVATKVSLEGPLTRVLVLALSAFFNGLMMVALYGLFDRAVGQGRSTADMARTVGYETAANLVFGVFIFYFLDKVFAEKVAEGQMRVRRRYYE
jgi:rod shape-determining protein MreD